MGAAISTWPTNTSTTKPYSLLPAVGNTLNPFDFRVSTSGLPQPAQDQFQKSLSVNPEQPNIVQQKIPLDANGSALNVNIDLPKLGEWIDAWRSGQKSCCGGKRQHSNPANLAGTLGASTPSNQYQPAFRAENNTENDADLEAARLVAASADKPGQQIASASNGAVIKNQINYINYGTVSGNMGGNDKGNDQGGNSGSSAQGSDSKSQHATSQHASDANNSVAPGAAPLTQNPAMPNPENANTPPEAQPPAQPPAQAPAGPAKLSEPMSTPGLTDAVVRSLNERLNQVDNDQVRADAAMEFFSLIKKDPSIASSPEFKPWVDAFLVKIISDNSTLVRQPVLLGLQLGLFKDPPQEVYRRLDELGQNRALEGLEPHIVKEVLGTLATQPAHQNTVNPLMSMNMPGASHAVDPVLQQQPSAAPPLLNEFDPLSLQQPPPPPPRKQGLLGWLLGGRKKSSPVPLPQEAAGFDPASISPEILAQLAAGQNMPGQRLNKVH